MNQEEKNQSPESYSADYRSSFPSGDKKAPPVKRQRPPEPEQREKKRRVPAAPPKREPASPAVPSAARRARLENDTEIDDFLPESDSMEDERLLTKWDDGIEPKPQEKSGERPRRRGRHRYGIFVGSLVLILALAGVGFIATTIGTKIHSALTDDTKLRQYDQFLTVAVAQDPQPFTSPGKADSDFVLNASLWQCMTGDNASGYTDYDDAGRTIVPLGDVVDACRQLFGPDCQLQPKNPTEETFFEYDSQNAQFHVALYSLDSTYTPYTESAKRKDGMTVLKVGYVAPSDETRAQSGSTASGTAPKPVKYMEYDLKTDSSTQKEYIYAVKTLTE